MAEAATIEQPAALDAVVFPIADEAIAELNALYGDLTIDNLDDAEGFEEVKAARKIVRSKRLKVEEIRKLKKAKALEYGRIVDGEAKRLTALLSPLESHLASEIDAYNAEREAIKQAERDAKRAATQERVDALAQVGVVLPWAEVEAMAADEFEAELLTAKRAHAAKAEAEAKAKAEREAEERRLRQEREAIEKERAEVAAKAKAEREAVEKERSAMAAERQAIEQEKAERERERVAEAERLEREKAEAARLAELEAIKPDRDKLLAYLDAIDLVVIPDVSDKAQELADAVECCIGDAVVKARLFVQ